MNSTQVSDIAGDEGEAGGVCEFLVHDLQGSSKAMRCVGESGGRLLVEAQDALSENTLSRFRLQLEEDSDLFLVVESCEPMPEGGFALELRPFDTRILAAARKLLHRTKASTRVTRLAKTSLITPRSGFALTLHADGPRNSLASAVTTWLVSCAALFCALLQQLP